jgi:hypothetical protein
MSLFQLTSQLLYKAFKVMESFHDFPGNRALKTPGPSRRTISRRIDAGDIPATTI